MKISTLLNRKSKWIKFFLGKDSTGTGCAGNNPAAVRFCLIGAAQRCYDPVKQARAHARVLVKLFRCLPKRFVQWGDHRGNLVGFNNASDTKFTDVRRLVLKAGV